MHTYTFHDAETAPAAAQPFLRKAENSFGFIPNLLAGLANAPAALEAYLRLDQLFSNSSLDPVERQVVLLSTSVVNGCEFCVAAHSMIAKKMAGVPESVVTAIRDNRTIDDTKLAALAAFTVAVVEQRGWVKDHPSFIAFLEAGYQAEQALDVILGVTQKTISNYANHLLETPLNDAFANEQWSAPHKG